MLFIEIDINRVTQQSEAKPWLSECQDDMRVEKEEKSYWKDLYVNAISEELDRRRQGNRHVRKDTSSVSFFHSNGKDEL